MTPEKINNSFKLTEKNSITFETSGTTYDEVENIKEKMYKGKRSEALNLIDICNITKNRKISD